MLLDYETLRLFRRFETLEKSFEREEINFDHVNSDMKQFASEEISILSKVIWFILFASLGCD